MNQPTPNALSRTARLARRIAFGLGPTLALGVAAFVVGPRYKFGASTPTARERPPSSIAKLDAWLARQEATYTDIRPGCHKNISWHAGAKKRTPWAVVNIHGYSASCMETAPVSDILAKALGANRFDTRLTGHGRSGPAMAEATPQDWMADTLEAVRIGRTLGERVLMLGTSTGATLEAWLAMQPGGMGADAYIFISPNFGPKDARSNIAFLPWGLQIVHAVFGETRDLTDANPRINEAFTTRYPFKAIFPMMGLVRHVNGMDLAKFRAPVLVLYSERDQVISTVAMKKAFARLGSVQKDIRAIDYSTDVNQHVLASEIRSPESVGPLTDTIIQWLKATVARAAKPSRQCAATVAT